MNKHYRAKSNFWIRKEYLRLHRLNPTDKIELKLDELRNVMRQRRRNNTVSIWGKK